MNINKESFNKFEIVASRPSTHIILIALIGIFIYSNTLTVPFQFDDIIITEKSSIATFEIFSWSKWANLYNAFKSRYINYLTFAINYSFHGTSVFGYHAVNLIIHIINAILLYFLVALTLKTPFFMVRQFDKLTAHHNTTVTLSHEPVRTQADSPRRTSRLWQPIHLFTYLPLFVALLFISHPIQTQAVTYISQRATSMATMFCLLSIVMYIKARLTPFLTLSPRWEGMGGGDYSELSPQRVAEGDRTHRLNSVFWYLGSILSAVLAMKTKEISLTFPIVIALYEFMFFEMTFRKRLIFLISLLLTILIIPLTFLDINKPIGEIISDVSDTTMVKTSVSRIDYLFTQFRVIVTYLRLLFLPINQNLDYDYPIYHSFLEPQVMLSFLFLLGIFGLGVYLLIKGFKVQGFKGSNNQPSTFKPFNLKLISFGIFWFFITLSVESSIIPIKDMIFEHRVYLPSVGFFIAFSTVVFYIFRFTHSPIRPFTDSPIHRFTHSPFPVYCLLSTIIIVLAVTANMRNNVWKTDMSLWSDVVKKSPKKARGYNNLGNAYLYKGSTEKAIEYYKKALILDPDQKDSHNNLGVIYQSKGLTEKAIEHYQKAIKAKPDFALAYYNLGNLYKNKGLLDKAIEYYQKTLSLKPEYVIAYNNLGNIYESKGLTDKAIECYKKAVDLKPDLPETHFNLGNVYSSKGITDKAMEHYQKAVDIKPDFIAAHFNLGTIHLSKNIPEGAIEHYQKVLDLKPDHYEAHNNIGSAYLFRGLTDKAIEHYQEALSIKPDFAGAHSNLCNAYLSKNLTDKAIEHCQKALRLKPDLAEAYNNLGIAYQSKGQPEKAMRHYQKALSLTPDFAKAHFNLARIYYDKGLINNARKELEMVIKINPNDQQARSILEELNKRQ